MADKYVALLRGINVGKAKRVAMAELRVMLEKLGYQDVKTLLNSGNVVFSCSKGNSAEIAERIEKSLAAKLGVTARVIVLSSSTLNQVIKENGLLKVMESPSQLLVGVMHDTGSLSGLAALRKQDWGKDSLYVGKQAFYAWCGNGILESKLLVAIGKVMKDSMTARNWATMLKLQAMMEPGRTGRAVP